MDKEEENRMAQEYVWTTRILRVFGILCFLGAAAIVFVWFPTEKSMAAVVPVMIGVLLFGMGTDDSDGGDYTYNGPGTRHWREYHDDN